MLLVLTTPLHRFLEISSSVFKPHYGSGQEGDPKHRDAKLTSRPATSEMPPPAKTGSASRVSRFLLGFLARTLGICCGRFEGSLPPPPGQKPRLTLRSNRDGASAAGIYSEGWERKLSDTHQFKKTTPLDVPVQAGRGPEDAELRQSLATPVALRLVHILECLRAKWEMSVEPLFQSEFAQVKNLGGCVRKRLAVIPTMITVEGDCTVASHTGVKRFPSHSGTFSLLTARLQCFAKVE